jgi:8-oxo-dGTP pyrophosphatase MutT (NUDIX family)
MKKTVVGYPDIDVAAAVIMNQDGQILWTWNDTWGTFSLPMTKIRSSREMAESPRGAAVRATAEALGVPVQVGKEWTDLPMMRVSDRDFAVKHYSYHVFQAGPHPDYSAALRIRQPHIWLAAHVALSGLFEPLSYSAREILRGLVQRGLVSGRKQETCILIFAREHNGNREFLLRWNPNWGYALPAKRKAATKGKDAAREALAVAQRVAVEELGLDPKSDVSIRPAERPMVETFGVSKTKGKPGFGTATDYGNWIFDAVLQKPDNLKSREPVIWVSRNEIMAGEVGAKPAADGSLEAPPGNVSPTVFQILSALGHVPAIVVPVPLPPDKAKRQ